MKLFKGRGMGFFFCSGQKDRTEKACFKSSYQRNLFLKRYHLTAISCMPQNKLIILSQTSL